MVSDSQSRKNSEVEKSGQELSLADGSIASHGSEKEEALNTSNSDREQFDNPIEFILTCLGLSVGLGNIWRFPTRAYENGGSAFLIPYVTCAIFFGLPVVYLEFLAGQYAEVSPPIVFRRIRPILEGVGYMGPIVSAMVSVYYIVIVAWICLYLFNIFRGHLGVWNNCDNEWNDRSTVMEALSRSSIRGMFNDTCIDMLTQKLCDPSYTPVNKSDQLHDLLVNTNSTTKMVYINGSCHDAKSYANVTLLSATEQYFKRNIVRPSKGFFDINEINYPILIAMVTCWVLTALMILKGVRVIAKITYVTVLLPYFIVLVLFFRGITLDGASEGLYFYLGNPDFAKLCFSLALGYGALMGLASYNRKRHNCFRDALILIIGDTTMSVVGGAGVFSTLGFLAKHRGVPVPDVIESGFSLTFVVYPEAMTQMPLPWLWGFLFFLMLFLLGISSEVAMVEVFCTCIYDRYPSLRKRKATVVISWCLVLFLIGFILATDAGIYWLTMFDEYSSGFSSVFTSITEILVFMYIYKARNFRRDILEMLGEARNSVTAAIGPQSPYFTWNWRIISPIMGLVLITLSFNRDYPYEGKPDVYPVYFDIFGWFIALLPPLMIIVFAILNYIQFRSESIPARALFSIQKQHPSFNRIVGEMSESKRNELITILPDTEPWTVLKSSSPFKKTDEISKSTSDKEKSLAETII